MKINIDSHVYIEIEKTNDNKILFTVCKNDVLIFFTITIFQMTKVMITVKQFLHIGRY